MRITFVVAQLDLSGGSRIIATYARMLADRGHQVTIVVPSRRPLPWRRRLRNFLSTSQWHTPSETSHYDNLSVEIRVSENHRLRESDVPDADVIIATWWETAEWVGEFGARKGAKVYLVQGHEVFDHLPVERVRATYHLPFTKIVVSGWLQRIMSETYGDHDALLVPNAVDHAVFDAPPRGRQPVPTLGFMYGAAHLKGPDLAAEAIRRVRAALPQLRVVAFGAYALEGMSDVGPIEFERRPSPEGLRRAYATCDVWLCSSRSEGFGLPAMEAMACRTPVVSTMVGWPLDAIRSGVNGYLVPVDDAPGLAEAALAALRLDDTAWRAMSDRAYETARAVNWPTSLAQFEAALEVARERSTRLAA